MNGIEKALILHGVRWAATSLGVTVAAFAFSHTEIMSWVQKACTLMTDQQAMEVGIPGLAVAVASLFLGGKNVFTVGDKITTAAATGSVEAVNNPAIRAATVAAVKSGQIPPPAPAPKSESLDDLIAARQAAARGG